MPKTIELTIEIDVQRVSCPGVWLCQDGRVSLTVFALGTRYQTGLLPPVFPLAFNDIFYFRKRFEETCALNNICCLLKEETIYCELVQWCEECTSVECLVLAQYLGTLNDVLFPPNMCSSDGVDLLMRRSKEFPGILAPKIEITTKVRIDEVWSGGAFKSNANGVKVHTCSCFNVEASRQKPVCHSAQYHRSKCTGSPRRETSITKTRSRSGSRSAGSRSFLSLKESVLEPVIPCNCINPLKESRMFLKAPVSRRAMPFCVYTAQPSPGRAGPRARAERSTLHEAGARKPDCSGQRPQIEQKPKHLSRTTLQSRGESHCSEFHLEEEVTQTESWALVDEPPANEPPAKRDSRSFSWRAGTSKRDQAGATNQVYRMLRT